MKKLYLLPIQGMMQYKQAFEYANKYLEGMVVWIGNSDIYLADGWEKLNTKVMKKGKRVYSITRQENCPDLKEGCSGQNAIFGGSDCFVFVPPIHSTTLEHMDHPTNVWGAENNVIFQLMQSHYVVTNPCVVLGTFHNHCSRIRPKLATERVNTYNARGRGSGVSRLVQTLTANY